MPLQCRNVRTRRLHYFTIWKTSFIARLARIETSKACKHSSDVMTNVLGNDARVAFVAVALSDLLEVS